MTATNWEVIWNMLRHKHRKDEESRRGMEKHLEDLEVASELESLVGGGEFTNQRNFETLEKESEIYMEHVRKGGRPYNTLPVEEARESVEESKQLLQRAEEMLQHLKEQAFKNRFYGLKNKFGMTSSKVKPIAAYGDEGDESDGTNSQT